MPPILFAVAGLVHPHFLTAETAESWQRLHIFLLLVFPLLAIGFIVPLWERPGRNLAGLAAVVAWIGAFTYAVFYAGLDLVAGFSAGTVVDRRTFQHRLDPYEWRRTGNDVPPPRLRAGSRRPRYWLPHTPGIVGEVGNIGALSIGRHIPREQHRGAIDDKQMDRRPDARSRRAILYAATSPEAESGAYYGPDGIGEMRGFPAKVTATREAYEPALGMRL